jgi:nuclear pore complex protein Nup93
LIEEERDKVHAQYTLKEFQNLLVKFGPQHFMTRNNNPLNYFHILLLSGQFERAIAFLYETDHYKVDAVHFAISCAYYGVIRVPSNPETSPLYVEDKGEPLLNFPQLIVDYTSSLTSLDVINYLSLIGIFRNDLFTDFALRKLKTYLIESRDFNSVLGSIDSHGQRISGYMDKLIKLFNYSNEKEYIVSLTVECAKTSQLEGRVKDSLSLYNLAEQYDLVLDLLAKNMGDSLLLSYEQIEKSELASLTKSVLNYYEGKVVLDAGKKRTCAMLLSLIEFFKLYKQQRYESALSVIESTGLIPMNVETFVLSKKAEELKSLDESIAKNFSEILVATMTILYEMYSALKESQYMDASRKARLNDLKARSRSLMTFAGLVSFRMSQDTYARLNRMDVFMN